MLEGEKMVVWGKYNKSAPGWVGEVNLEEEEKTPQRREAGLPRIRAGLL